YDRACGWGYLPGCTSLARLYEAGTLVARDVSGALELYRSTCRAREPTACVRLGMLTEQAPGGAVDAAPLYEQACNDPAMGCGKLAPLYPTGNGGRTDIARARAPYRRGRNAA